MHAVQCSARVFCRHGLWQLSPRPIYEVKKAACSENLRTSAASQSLGIDRVGSAPKSLRMASTTAAGEAPLPPWYVGCPASKSEAAAISREDVLLMLRDGKNIAGKDFVLVDLRRNDHEVYRPTPLPLRSLVTPYSGQG